MNFLLECDRCFDPFHVVEWVMEALDEVRREVWQEAYDELKRWLWWASHSRADAF